MAFDRAIFALGFSAIAAMADPVKAECSDLALVLAIDASGSIDTREYVLQMQGYAEALLSDEVAEAIAEAGRVEAMAIVWGDADFSIQHIGWVRLDRAEERARFAAALSGLKRAATGNTGLARALEESLDLLEALPDCDGRVARNAMGDLLVHADAGHARKAIGRLRCRHCSVALQQVPTDTVEFSRGHARLHLLSHGLHRIGNDPADLDESLQFIVMCDRHPSAALFKDTHRYLPRLA